MSDPNEPSAPPIGTRSTPTHEEGTHRISSLRITREMRALLTAVRGETAHRSGLPIGSITEASVLREAIDIGLDAMAAGLDIGDGEQRVAISPEARKHLQSAAFLLQRGVLPERAMAWLEHKRSAPARELIEVALRSLVEK